MDSRWIVVCGLALAVAALSVAAGCDQGKAEASEATAPAAPVIVPLEPFIVNLSDDGRTRYLKATFSLRLEAQAGTEAVKQWAAPLRDRVIGILSGMQAAEAQSAEAKAELKRKVLAEVNGVLPGGGVEDVYLTEFVVQ